MLTVSQVRVVVKKQLVQLVTAPRKCQHCIQCCVGTQKLSYQQLSIRMLMQHGADPRRKNSNGDTALTYAHDIGDDAIIHLLTRQIDTK